MKTTEDKISIFVKNHFPDFYKEEGPLFVAFLQAYYEWLESTEETLYYARKLGSYRDIDTTIEDFIVHFKEKYLRNIQFETESNKTLFIKHALDFYRSKGTERAADLFFKLIYGVPANVYYPGDDLFKLSAGDWSKPTYIEVSPSLKNMDYIGKQITGLSSGASAFVDDYVIRRAKGRYIYVFYISNLTGLFETGEYLSDGNSDTVGNPVVTGSLTTVTIVDGGSDFEVGETINFVSNSGSYGKALITSTEDIAGVVRFTLNDGGFGYNSNSTVLISNQIISVEQLTNTAFIRFETLTQDLARIEYSNANGTFADDTFVYRYYSNGSVAGTGKIVQTNTAVMTVSVSSGNLELGTANIFATANAITANTLVISKITATGNAIGQSTNATIIVDTYTGTFEVGERIKQSNSTAEWANGTVRSVVTSGSNLVISATRVEGTFLSNTTITGVTSGYTANVKNHSVKIGLVSISNTFYTNGYVVGSTSGTTGTIGTKSLGNGATFSLGTNSTFTYMETSNTNMDIIGDYANVYINATAYGMTYNPTANVSTPIIDTLLFQNLNYGTITNNSITLVNGGSGYSDAPIVTVLDVRARSFSLRDYVITIDSATGNFITGEQIKQSNGSGGAFANGAMGLVLSSNATTIEAKRIKIANSFSNAVSAQSFIVGVSSGVIARLVEVTADITKEVSGLNANMTGNTVFANGSVVTAEIVNSGFGYVDDEDVTFYKTGDDTFSGEATLYLGYHGSGIGYYRETGGVLSGSKKLHDGEYYQEYSYEVQTQLPFEKYADMFKKVAHVAGTALFGSYVEESIVTSNLVPSNSSYITVYGPHEQGTVSIVAGANTITGSNTLFSSIYANGDEIAIRHVHPANLVFVANSTGDMWTEYTFNGQTAVSNTTDAITVGAGAIALGDMIVYSANMTSGAVGSLYNGRPYYVVQSNSTTIQLSNTAGGTALGLEPTAVSSTHKIWRSPITVPASANVGDLAILFDVAEASVPRSISGINPSTAVDPTLDVINVPGNYFIEDDIVKYLVAAGNTAIGGLTNASSYYIAEANSSSFQLAVNATASVIELSIGANETGHSFTIVNETPEKRIPTGWAEMKDISNSANSTTDGIRAVVSYKIIESTDVSKVLTETMIPCERSASKASGRIMLITRGKWNLVNTALSNIHLLNTQSSFVTTDPVAQIMPIASEDPCILGLVLCVSTDSGHTFSATPAMTNVSLATNTFMTVGYKIYDSSPADITVDTTDGGVNLLLSMVSQPHIRERIVDRMISTVNSNTSINTTDISAYTNPSAKHSTIERI